jgi:hypothetical protein
MEPLPDFFTGVSEFLILQVSMRWPRSCCTASPGGTLAGGAWDGYNSRTGSRVLVRKGALYGRPPPP